METGIMLKNQKNNKQNKREKRTTISSGRLYFRITPLESKACMFPRLMVEPNLKLDKSPPSTASSASNDSFKWSMICVML